MKDDIADKLKKAIVSLGLVTTLAVGVLPAEAGNQTVASLGRSGAAPTEVWGAHLPKQQIHEDAGGGTDQNPCTYKASDYEKALLARAIAIEAKDYDLLHQIMVGEVIMRRVMSSQWGGGREKTIHAVLSAPGQYPHTWQKLMGRIQNLTPPDMISTLAAAIALSGTTNYSKGAYFQHSKQKYVVCRQDNRAFSDTESTANFKLKDFRTAMGYHPEYFNPGHIGKQKAPATVAASTLSTGMDLGK